MTVVDVWSDLTVVSSFVEEVTVTLSFLSEGVVVSSFLSVGGVVTSSFPVDAETILNVLVNDLKNATLFFRNF